MFPLRSTTSAKILVSLRSIVNGGRRETLIFVRRWLRWVVLRFAFISQSRGTAGFYLFPRSAPRVCACLLEREGFEPSVPRDFSLAEKPPELAVFWRANSLARLQRMCSPWIRLVLGSSLVRAVPRTPTGCNSRRSGLADWRVPNACHLTGQSREIPRHPGQAPQQPLQSRLPSSPEAPARGPEASPTSARASRISRCSRSDGRFPSSWSPAATSRRSRNIESSP